MKNNNINTFKLVCIIICILFLGFFAYRNSIPSYAYALIEHTDEYSRIAKICYLDYLSASSKDDSEKCYTYSLAVDDIYCHTNKQRIALNDYEIECMQIVNDTFYVEKKNLDCIRVENNFVSFCTVNGRGSYIYSVNNKRPTFVNSSTDDYKIIFVKKVADHWYYGRVIQQH